MKITNNPFAQHQRPQVADPFQSTTTSPQTCHGTDVYEPADSTLGQQAIHPAFQPPLVLPSKLLQEEGAILIIGRPKARVVIDPNCASGTDFYMSTSSRRGQCCDRVL